jgi:hypothetical protein
MHPCLLKFKIQHSRFNIFLCGTPCLLYGFDIQRFKNSKIQGFCPKQPSVSGQLPSLVGRGRGRGKIQDSKFNIFLHISLCKKEKLHRVTQRRHRVPQRLKTYPGTFRRYPLTFPGYPATFYGHPATFPGYP